MNKRRDIRNFYVDEAFIPVWTEFMEICKREGDSASKKIRDLLTHYVHVHRHGNPQMLLKSFGAKHSLTCSRCRKTGFKTLRPVKVDRHPYPVQWHVCKPCYDDLINRTLIKK